MTPSSFMVSFIWGVVLALLFSMGYLVAVVVYHPPAPKPAKPAFETVPYACVKQAAAYLKSQKPGTAYYCEWHSQRVYILK